MAESPPHSLGKPTTFSGLSALTSMMAAGTESLPPSSLVTPDYQPHGIRSLKGPGKEELSLSITKEVITLTADGGKSPRSPKKIQLAPRTGTSMLHNTFALFFVAFAHTSNVAFSYYVLITIPSPAIILIAPSQKLGIVPPPSPSSSKRSKSTTSTGSGRLNKFVRRLYDMLAVEQGSGVVEWRRGLLVIYSTDSFTKKLLPKYFNTRNFKTFRRQLVRRLLPSCSSRMDDVYVIFPSCLPMKLTLSLSCCIFSNKELLWFYSYPILLDYRILYNSPRGQPRPCEKVHG